MPVVRPISDLRNKTPEIERLCRESGDPVYVTKNGKAELVVLSVAAYEREQARLELYGELAKAEDDVRRGDRGVAVATVRKVLRQSRP